MPGGNCVFNDLWLDMKPYKDWLLRSQRQRDAFCVACHKTFDIGNMGEAAIKSHMKGKKHQSLTELAVKKVVSVKDFFSAKNFTVENQQSIPSTSSCADNLDSFFSTNITVKAEIMWALKVLNSGFSYKSCEDISTLFRGMFPDSEIAKKFTCGERKCAYLTVFGIAPHFSNLLKENVKSAGAYVLLFDESLNEQLQSKQLDCHVRFWDNDTVSSRYYSSDFLGHSTADILFDKLNEKCLTFGSSSLLQLSMDGPNVNWSVYSKMVDYLKSEGCSSMLNIGSCSLHILHNAFSCGCSVFPEVEETAYALHRLFKDSPARRDDYATLADNVKFPLKFCKHRWLENVSVLRRMLDILPDIKKYVSCVLEKKFPHPGTKTFETIQRCVKDVLFPVKCNFFIYIANEVEPYLTLYQTDKPMLPFISGDLHTIVKSLLQKFVKDELLLVSSLKLINIDLDNLSNLKDASMVDIGFVTKKQIKELTKNKQITDKQKMEFYLNCKSFLMSMTKKLVNKCPLKYSIIRNISCLDPRTLITCEKSNISKMQNILLSLTDASKVKESDCDSILKEFRNFIEEFKALDLHARFKGCSNGDFDPAIDRIDTFYFNFLSKDPKYLSIWRVVSMLLLLSHGQATVERGFSVNKNLMVENLKEQSIVAKRVIDDHLRSIGGLSNVVINKSLIMSALNARQRYHMYLDEQKQRKLQPVVSEKRKALLGKIDDLKCKKKRLEDDIAELQKSSVEFAEKAERTGRVPLISKSNACRRSASEKQALLSTIDAKLNEKCLEFKN